MDQFEWSAPLVRIFLQYPGFDLPASIGKANLIKIILDDSLVLGRSLSTGTSRRNDLLSAECRSRLRRNGCGWKVLGLLLRLWCGGVRPRFFFPTGGKEKKKGSVRANPKNTRLPSPDFF